jgi:hypothetical protein
MEKRWGMRKYPQTNIERYGNQILAFRVTKTHVMMNYLLRYISLFNYNTTVPVIKILQFT